MGKFNKNLDATFNPPRKWVLNSALSYDCDDLTEQEIDTLKAVGIISPYDLARAAIIHDQLYKQIRQHRWSHLQDNDFETDIERRAIVQAKAVADKIFLCASNDAVPKVPAWKCNAAYYAVRAFGRWSIVPNVDNI